MKEIRITKNILTENSAGLQDFFKDIDKYKIYPSEEQIKLAAEAKKGNDKSREKLINSNLRFVVTCAKKYVGQGVPLMDLIQAGILGLIQSIENFDPDRGIKFLSFAVWYIRREILKEIYNTGRTIRYPITYISRFSKINKIVNDYINKYYCEPTEEELLKLTNLTHKQYNTVQNKKSYCISFDNTINGDSKSTLKDIIKDESYSVDIPFVKETISKALRYLNPREYKVITEFYGLEGQPEKSIKEIAKEMNLGDERIRQLRKGAIKKLEQRCGKVLKTLL